MTVQLAEEEARDLAVKMNLSVLRELGFVAIGRLCPECGGVGVRRCPRIRTTRVTYHLCCACCGTDWASFAKARR